MRHLKKFESSIDERIRYQEILEDFVQDIRDDEYIVNVNDETKSSAHRAKFEITIKYKIEPIYHTEGIDELFKSMDKQAKLFELIKELLQRIKNCGDFDIDFAHFSDQNPRFNMTVRVK